MAYIQKVEDEASNLGLGLFTLILVGILGLVFIPSLAILIPIGIIGIVCVVIWVSMENDWVEWVYNQED